MPPNATTRPEMADSLVRWDMRHLGGRPRILDSACGRVKPFGPLSRAGTGVSELEQDAGVLERRGGLAARVQHAAVCVRDGVDAPAVGGDGEIAIAGLRL